MRVLRNLPHHFTALIVAVLGLLLFIYGAARTYDEYVFASAATSYVAEVIDVKAHVKTHRDKRSTKSTITYRPLMKFADETGRIQVRTTMESSSDYLFRNGQRVDILFDPARPSYLRIDTHGAYWKLGAALMIGGLLIAAAGAVAARKALIARFGRSLDGAAALTKTISRE